MRGHGLALLAVLLLTGCGGRSDGDVIRAWTDAVRTQDYEAAADLFAVPATVANGTPKLRLATRAAVDRFNRSLSCGATVLDTQAAAGGYVVATFRLTDGPGCRGSEAKVSFRIADGRITEWLREATEAPPGSTEV